MTSGDVTSSKEWFSLIVVPMIPWPYKRFAKFNKCHTSFYETARQQTMM